MMRSIRDVLAENKTSLVNSEIHQWISHGH